MTSAWSAGQQDVVLTKYDSVMAYQWALHWGGTKMEYAEEVCPDTTGQYVYICGSTTSTEFVTNVFDMFIISVTSAG